MSLEESDIPSLVSSSAISFKTESESISPEETSFCSSFIERRAICPAASLAALRIVALSGSNSVLPLGNR